MNASPIVLLLVGFAAGFFARSFLWLSIVVLILAIAGWIYLGSGTGGPNLIQSLKRILKR